MKEPEFRPRGMGLGVERKKPPKRNNDETSDLRMCKGAYVRAFQGPLQGCYGKVLLTILNENIQVNLAIHRLKASMTQLAVY
jgi:hypothetical protein